MELKKLAFAMVLIASAGLTIQYAQAGVITIIQRESSAKNVLFAGSAGAVQQHDQSNSLASLTGAFGFSDSGSVAVFENDPFSNGTVDASGSITVSDNVTQGSPDSVVLTATRSASGTANHQSGTGNGISTQGQTFRVRFTTGDDPVNYSLTGNFDPGITTGIIGENGRISLHRPFTANNPVLITTANAGINEIGTLPANRTYELLIRMTDKISANAGSPSAADASSLNIIFTLQSVPEPATVVMLTLTSSLLTIRRQPRPLVPN